MLMLVFQAGLEEYIADWLFICINTTCMREAKAYISLHICTAWPGPLLHDDNIGM